MVDVLPSTVVLQRDSSVKWFFVLGQSRTEIKDVKKFLLAIINGDMLSVTSLGVLGEYAKSLFASSSSTLRFFLRILRLRLNTFHVFGDDFVYCK
jgi:hypothetical protein